MKFERSKVVDGLCDNLEQWIGWKGYLSNRLLGLKSVVECETEILGKVDKVNTVSAFPFNAANNDWQFFYPVEPPKKQKFVPFRDSKEMVESYLGYAPNDGLPLIWVKHKGVGYNVLITGYNKGFVFIEDGWKRMWELLDEYMFLDGTPIGRRRND